MTGFARALLLPEATSVKSPSALLKPSWAAGRRIAGD